MKKIRLSERELTNIIKKVINEGVLIFRTPEEITEILKQKGATYEKPIQIPMYHHFAGPMVKIDNSWYCIGEDNNSEG
jgi:hypothetical protein